MRKNISDCDVANLPGRLRELRLKRKLTQTELGELTGIAQFRISRFESDPQSPGHRRPTYAEVLALAVALRVDPAELALPKKTAK